MFITHLNSKARIILPENFIHPTIAEKYNNYLGSTEIDGQSFLNVKDYLMHTIQGLENGSNLTMDSIQQTRYSGKQNHFKGSVKDNFELWPREITLNFIGESGYLNYIIILEELFRHHTMGFKEDHYIGDIHVVHYDMKGNALIRMTYKYGLFSSLSDVRFDFRDTDDSGEDFQLSLSISGVEVERLFDN